MYHITREMPDGTKQRVMDDISSWNELAATCDALNHQNPPANYVGFKDGNNYAAYGWFIWQ